MLFEMRRVGIKFLIWGFALENENNVPKRKPAAGANQIVYSRGEEWTNIITHIVAGALSLVASVFMLLRVSRTGDGLKITSIALYSASLIEMYVMSALYHAQPVGRRRRAVFRRFDHCSIALLIAGTYAPFMLIGFVDLGGAAKVCGIVIASVVLAMAILVIVFNAINVAKFRVFCMIAYVIMGWCCVMRADLILRLPGHSFLFLVLGGATYTVGILFYRIKRIPWNHAIWHFFVMAASALHFVAVYCYLLG